MKTTLPANGTEPSLPSTLNKCSSSLKWLLPVLVIAGFLIPPVAHATAELFVSPTLLSESGGTLVTATMSGGQFYSGSVPPPFQVRLTHEGSVIGTLTPESVNHTRITFRFPALSPGYYGWLVRLQYPNGTWEEVYRSSDRLFKVDSYVAVTSLALTNVYHTFYPQSAYPTVPHNPGAFLDVTNITVSGVITGYLTIPTYVNDGDARLNINWTKNFRWDHEDVCGLEFKLDFILEGETRFSYSIPYVMTLMIPTKVYAGQPMKFKGHISYPGGDRLQVNHDHRYSTDNSLWVNAPYDLMSPLSLRLYQKHDRLTVSGSLPLSPPFISLTLGATDIYGDFADGEASSHGVTVRYGGLENFVTSSTAGGRIESMADGSRELWTGQIRADELWSAAGDQIAFLAYANIPYVSVAAAILNGLDVELENTLNLDVLSKDWIHLMPPDLYDFEVTIPWWHSPGTYNLDRNFYFVANAKLLSQYIYNLSGGIGFDMPGIDRRDSPPWSLADMYSDVNSGWDTPWRSFHVNTTIEVLPKENWIAYYAPASPEGVLLANYTDEESTAERQWLASLTVPAPPSVSIIPTMLSGTFPTKPESECALMISASPSAGGTVAVSPPPVDGGYAAGTVVTLTASPAGGCQFLGWSGAVTGSANPATLTMNDVKEVTAIFYVPAYTFTTLAGPVGGSMGAVDGLSNAARFNRPRSVACDSAGNLYVADTQNHTIRKMTPGGMVTTLAGLAGSFGSADGTGSAARFNNPGGVAVDSAGNVYVADTYNSTIRKITPDGVVTTLAGLAGSSGSADGTGSAARFGLPYGVAVDSAHNVYVADTYNSTIRKITPDGAVTTLAGLPRSYGSADGTGSEARFNQPLGVAVDGAGNVYVADTYNGTIRELTPAGVVTTLAGLAGSFGSTDGTGSAARFYWPSGVAVDSTGNLYVGDSGSHTIRKVTSSGIVTTFAGLAWNSGSADGTGSAARFNVPRRVAVDRWDNVYVADYLNNTIRKVTPGGVVTTLAGLAEAYGSEDGTGSAARFRDPQGVAVDLDGNVYVADLGNHTIRKITPGGAVTTLAGLAGGYDGSADGQGSAARFTSPAGVAVDSAGNVYVGDTGNHTIRKITPSGIVTTLAGLARSPGCADGTGSAVRFNYPYGVAVDSAGNVYVADFYNHSIRRGAIAAPDTPVIDAATGPVSEVRHLDTMPQTASTWQWEVIRRPVGSSIALSSASLRNPTFTPDAPGLYVFRLTATTAAGQVAISTVELLAEAFPVWLQAAVLQTSGQVTLTLHSVPGRGCELQISTNLVHWTPLITLTNATGADVFMDTQTTQPCRFYRLRQ